MPHFWVLGNTGGTSFSCVTRPVAGYCSGPNSTNATCGRYTTYYRTLCDEPPFPKFLGPGDMYSRFTKLRDGRLLLTYSHRLCEVRACSSRELDTASAAKIPTA